MDPVRFGLSVRALRRRRRWTQAELGRRARVSRSAIARIERGEADQFTVELLTRVATALGARIAIRILWQGEALDRLLDADHAALVEWIVARLTEAGWLVFPEATFSIRGERGSIDVLALHPETGSLLVVEVKSVVPDVQALLAGLDRKVRVAPTIAAERGLPAASVSRLLVLPGDRTARRWIGRHAATFDRVLPARTREAARWIAAPRGQVAAILFVSGVTDTGGRHRIAARRASD